MIELDKKEVLGKTRAIIFVVKEKENKIT